jgi:hypothetical protein
MATKQGANVLFCMPNRTKSILGVPATICMADTPTFVALQFLESGPVRQLRSALLLSDVLREREQQAWDTYCPWRRVLGPGCLLAEGLNFQEGYRRALHLG